MTVELDTIGWGINKSADTRVVYVALNGNDANDGLTEETAKKTVSAGLSLMRSGFPDWLMIERGVAVDPLPPLVGRSATEPMLVSSYGNGDYPVITLANGQKDKMVLKWGFGDMHGALLIPVSGPTPVPTPVPPTPIPPTPTPTPTPTHAYTWQPYKSGKSTLYRIFEDGQKRLDAISLTECRWLCGILKIAAP